MQCQKLKIAINVLKDYMKSQRFQVNCKSVKEMSNMFEGHVLSTKVVAAICHDLPINAPVN